jgi:hypothetical protein
MDVVIHARGEFGIQILAEGGAVLGVRQQDAVVDVIFELEFERDESGENDWKVMRREGGGGGRGGGGHGWRLRWFSDEKKGQRLNGRDDILCE